MALGVSLILVLGIGGCKHGVSSRQTHPPRAGVDDLDGDLVLAPVAGGGGHGAAGIRDLEVETRTLHEYISHGR